MFVHKFYMWHFSHTVMLVLMFVLESNGLFIDYTENTELIQQRVGYDIRLKCDVKGLIDERKVKDVKIHWYFKQCSENSSTGNCHDFYTDDWTKLPCEESFCKTDLLLHNVTERYSGLYKCTVFPYRLDTGHASDIQFVRTYQLDVKNTTMAVPEFLDSYPLNKTTQLGSQVVFQCRVHSEVHPTIKWFRRLNAAETSPATTQYYTSSGNDNFNILKYNGQTYELLPSAREKLISDEIYLSKLILHSISLQNEGFYACVAISYRGYKIREAYLQVNAEDEPDYWQDYDDTNELKQDPKEFLLLFLMPFGLAMIPFTAWSCYIIYKYCKKRSEVTIILEQQCFPEEIAAQEHMLRV